MPCRIVPTAISAPTATSSATSSSSTHAKKPSSSAAAMVQTGTVSTETVSPFCTRAKDSCLDCFMAAAMPSNGSRADTSSNSADETMMTKKEPIVSSTKL
eukprot:scaffold9021_cov118-Isochrysis_galbana.AAC.9